MCVCALSFFCGASQPVGLDGMAVGRLNGAESA